MASRRLVKRRPLARRGLRRGIVVADVVNCTPMRGGISLVPVSIRITKRNGVRETVAIMQE